MAQTMKVKDILGNVIVELTNAIRPVQGDILRVNNKVFCIKRTEYDYSTRFSYPTITVVVNEVLPPDAPIA